jgi:hypothetical protein
MAYARALQPYGSYSRPACSFDAELKAQTVAIEAESEEGAVVLFDATSPVDAAMSFARAHDRHRADFHSDAQLAALVEAWGEHNVAYVHAKAHAGVTVNEWADGEGTAALGDAVSPEAELRGRHCSAGLDLRRTSPRRTVLGMRGCAAARQRGYTILRANGSRDSPPAPFERTMATWGLGACHRQRPTASCSKWWPRDGLAPAGEGHKTAPDMRTAHARHPCPCGAAVRDWWHYVCHCPSTAEARGRLRAGAADARKTFAGDVAKGLWHDACASVEREPRDTGSERNLIRAISVGFPSELVGRARGDAQKKFDSVFAIAARVIAAGRVVDGPASAAAADEYKTAKAAKACLRTWARLAARAGPGAARLLASGRERKRAAAGRGFRARPSLPRALLRGAANALQGGHSLLLRKAAGVAARSLGEAVLLRLRRAWGVCREHAREASRAAKVPGGGWVLAGVFDT